MRLRVTFWNALSPDKPGTTGRTSGKQLNMITSPIVHLPMSFWNQLSNNYGFSISKEHYAGVPSEVTVPVLESLEYQQYALATSTVFFV